jgi:hypothetical protein
MSQVILRATTKAIITQSQRAARDATDLAPALTNFHSLFNTSSTHLATLGHGGWWKTSQMTVS